MAQDPNGKILARQLAWFLIPLVLVFAAPASAQLLPLGGGRLPTGGLLQPLPQTISRTTQSIGPALDDTLNTTTTIARDIVGRPLARQAAVQTIQGVRVVRNEILAIAPTAQSLAATHDLGFTLVRSDDFTSLGFTAAVLQAPNGMDTSSALAALRKADPSGHYDYDHIYNPDGGGGAPAALTTAIKSRQVDAAIGMIDAGIAVDHPAFKHSRMERACVAGGKAEPSTVHGTAVASLLIGDDDGFQGYLPGARLYAADVYCGQASGGSAEDIARALAWLAQTKATVVNISLSGPPNALLAAATQAFIKQGRVLVAAVGNDGPTAPERYPAAYPGVVGVTSVDSQNAIQIDANRGNDVAFAARGVDVKAATLQDRYAAFTGTSFAAPVVSARFATLLLRPDPIAVAQAWKALEHSAQALGASSRNPVFGYGYLAAPGNAVAQADAN